jgi:site-specific recombinase XerD
MPVENQPRRVYNVDACQASHEVPKSDRAMLLSEIAFFCGHVNGRLRVSEATYSQSYKSCAARLLEFFEDVPATEISPADLHDWQAWLDSRDIAVATRNSYVRCARSMWNQMRKRGVAVCDTAGVFRFRKEVKGVKSVSTANAWRMLAATGIRDCAILWLAMDSARRRGGLAGLRLDDFRVIWNDDIKEFYVVGQVTEKGDKPQILLAYHGAALALQAWLICREELLRVLRVADHGYAFIDIRSGAPLSAQTMSALTTKIAQRAGIPHNEPHNLHSFRHRRAKEMLKSLSLAEVRDILGHTDIKTTANVYAVNGPEELIEAFFSRGRGR